MDSYLPEEMILQDKTLSAQRRRKLKLEIFLGYLCDNLILAVVAALIGAVFLIIALWTLWQPEYRYIEQLLSGGA